MIIYMVISGWWKDLVGGVFSTEENARAYARRVESCGGQNVRVEEWIVDEENVHEG